MILADQCAIGILTDGTEPLVHVGNCALSVSDRHKEHDVRMACHPSDPPGFPFGYQRVDPLGFTAIFEAIKRYFSGQLLAGRETKG